MSALKLTPFNAMHKVLGAKMVPFVGWEMPVQFAGIVDETLCVRQKVGLFDVSHMGEVFVTGNGALEQVQNLITNDLRKIGDGRVVYTPMCYEHGGIVDDLLVYQFSPKDFMIIVNASNVEKDFKWISSVMQGVDVKNRSDDWAQLALQGPLAEKALQKITPHDLSTIGFFHVVRAKVAGVDAIVSRTGYTGEDGFEIYHAPEHAEKIFSAVMDAGREYGIQPIGLGARDVLRLEAGLMLYGNDIDENTTPLEATLKWTVSFDKDFIGKKALQEKPLRKKMVGFELLERAVPRHGMEVAAGGAKIGIVASGTFSPTLQKPIGNAFIPPDFAADKGFGIKINEKKEVPAKAVSPRFYRRKGK